MHYCNTPLKLQVELSSICNALCLGCVRTDTRNYNKTKAIIPKNQYLSLSTWEKVLTSNSMSHLKIIEFCGTIDDPIAYPDFLEVLEIAYKVNSKFRINIHTNGSMRTKEYWKKLATILKKFNEYFLLFSIDGLEDTHSIYRQRTSFSKIIENATAFIQEGGEATWQYLIFPWNEHQVEDAHNLSKKLGFSAFRKRHDRVLTNKKLKDILDLKEKNKHEESLISEVYSPPVIEDEIECNNQKYSMYFLSFDGKLWPCCFFHNINFRTGTTANELFQKKFEDYGVDWNNCNKYEVDDIINSTFYSNDLVKSWSSKTHGLNRLDRNFRCTETCSKKKLKTLPIGNAKVYDNRD